MSRNNYWENNGAITFLVVAACKDQAVYELQKLYGRDRKVKKREIIWINAYTKDKPGILWIDHHAQKNAK